MVVLGPCSSQVWEALLRSEGMQSRTEPIFSAKV